MKPAKKLTKQQMKNRELLAKSMTEPIKSKEEMEKQSKEFRKILKDTYGF